jgi:FkbM family methyltransferase
MSIFVKLLKKKGYLNSLNIAIGIIGSRKINPNDEYGYKDWQFFAPNLTIYGFDADADACEEANTELSGNKDMKWVEKHIPLALSNTCGDKKLYVTHEPMCSSLYPPNEELMKRYLGIQEVAGLDFSVEIETTTLDQFCDIENIKNIDFLQIDVQGADLDVLKGASSLLSKSVLGIQVEVEFVELYKGQPLFSDIDAFLRSQNFTLFDIIPIHVPRAKGPLTSELRSGQLLWGEAFYLRDPFSEQSQSSFFQSSENLLKLACIADILEFPDYSIEILEYLIHAEENPYPELSSVVLESLSSLEGMSHEDLIQMPVVQQILSTSADMQFPSHG